MVGSKKSKPQDILNPAVFLMQREKERFITKIFNLIFCVQKK